MITSEKISLWIAEQQELGLSNDAIARSEFVHVDSEGEICTYKLSKAGRNKFNLKIHIGAIDIDKWEPKEINN